MIRHQRAVQLAVDNLVALASLLLAPLLCAKLPADRALGVVTASPRSLTLALAGVPADAEPAIAGLDAASAFSRRRGGQCSTSSRWSSSSLPVSIALSSGGCTDVPGYSLPLARAAAERLPVGLVERLVAVRRELHRRPELSNQETETTALLRSELEQAGFSRVSPIGPTGLVVDVVGERPGPLVVVRGDIDALPLTEAADVPFRSTVPGVMHACGHDVHSAMALGVALAAREHREELAGTVRVVLQPAEEAEPLGGRAVVAGGHLDGAVAAVALHVDPGLETGTVGLRSGVSMASSDEFKITVHGRSSHAGWPHVGCDAVTAAASVIQEIQKIITRRIDPRSAVALNLGRIDGGVAANIVAEEVRILGTVRTLDEEARATARRLIVEVSEYAAAANGARVEVELVHGEPALYNDPTVIDAFAAVATRTMGEHACRWLEAPTMNSEDFAFYTERLPSAMAWIGVRDEERGFVHPLHHPCFAVDEAVIPLGVELLLETAVALLENPPPAERAGS